jgi:hypothetical protein
VQSNKLPQPPPQQQQPPQPEEDLLALSLAGAKKFFIANWLHMIFVLALIAAVILAVHTYQLRQEAHVMAAWGELGSLPADELQFVGQPEQAAQIRKEAMTAVEDVVQQSPKGPAVPWALLQLGSLQADGGDWTAAARTFSDLAAKYPTSEPVSTARAALATSLEGLAKYKEAADIYEKLAGVDQPYYLLSAARCRELAGEPEPAKLLYQKVRDTATKDESLMRIAAARLQDLAMGEPLTMPAVVQAAKAAVPAAPVAPVAPAAPPAATVAPPPSPAAPGSAPAEQPPQPAAQPGRAGGENR